jgi:hypothetical protein
MTEEREADNLTSPARRRELTVDLVVGVVALALTFGGLIAAGLRGLLFGLAAVCAGLIGLLLRGAKDHSGRSLLRRWWLIPLGLCMAALCAVAGDWPSLTSGGARSLQLKVADTEVLDELSVDKLIVDQARRRSEPHAAVPLLTNAFERQRDTLASQLSLASYGYIFLFYTLADAANANNGALLIGPYAESNFQNLSSDLARALAAARGLANS